MRFFQGLFLCVEKRGNHDILWLAPRAGQRRKLSAELPLFDRIECRLATCRIKRQPLLGAQRLPKKGDDMANSRTTTDHEDIRRWAEERGGVPSTVIATEQGGEPGILRIDFPGFSGEGTLEEISWDDFFRKFEESNLAFLFEDGSESRFNKLVSRETAQKKESSGRSRGRTRSAQARGRSTTARRSSGTRSRATRAKSSRSSGRKRSSSRTSARGRKTSGTSSRSSRSSGTRASSSRSRSGRTASARSRSGSSGRSKSNTTARAKKTTARASSSKRKVQSSRGGRSGSRRAA